MCFQGVFADDNGTINEVMSILMISEIGPFKFEAPKGKTESMKKALLSNEGKKYRFDKVRLSR